MIWLQSYANFVLVGEIIKFELSHLKITMCEIKKFSGQRPTENINPGTEAPIPYAGLLTGWPAPPLLYGRLR